MKTLTSFTLLFLFFNFFVCKLAYTKNIKDYPHYLQKELQLLNCKKIKNQYLYVQKFYASDYEEEEESPDSPDYILDKSALVSNLIYQNILKKGDSLNYQFFSKKNNSQIDYFWIVFHNLKLPKTTHIQKGITHFQTKPQELGKHSIFFVQKTNDNTCLLTQLNRFYVTHNPDYNTKPKKEINSSFTCYQTQLYPKNKQDCKDLPTLKELYHLTQIDAPKAWKISTGKGVKIALIDSGINYLNPYLNKQLIKPRLSTYIKNNETNSSKEYYGPYDFEFNDKFAFDEHGHGSQIAGFISSSFGVAPKAKVLNLKIHSAKISSIIKAFKASIKNKVHIINLSLVYLNHKVQLTPEEHAELLFVLDQLLKNDILVIQAAGNEGKDLDIPLHQSFFSQFNYPNWIKVTAYNEDFNKASYANYSNSRVDLIAPGGSTKAPLLSTFIHNSQDILLGSSQGTSQATAITSGIAALIRSQKPHLTALEVKEILLKAGTFSTELSYIVKSGRLLNAWDALNIK